MLGLFVVLAMSDRRRHITEQDFRYTKTGVLVVWSIIIMVLLCWVTPGSFNGYIRYTGVALTGMIYILDNIQADKKFLVDLRK